MKLLAKILSYPVSVIYYLLFGLTIVIFHPVQWICFNWFGYQAHKKSVDWLNWCLLRCQNILGTTFKTDIKVDVPAGVPVIIVSNHQSMWDIPPIIWFLRKYHPKFISKKELGSGIPSISYNLRHGGSVLIDRKDSRQALAAIEGFAAYLNENKRGGVIFPEGTRSKTGIPKPFRRSGLEMLFKNMPDAYVIPVSINNSWKLQRWGVFPIQLGVKFRIIAHPAVKTADFDVSELIDKVEKTITSSVYNENQL